MASISLAISEQLKDRLARLAGAQGLTLQECLHQALEEFAETQEDFMRTLSSLEDEFETRPRLESVVKQDERAALIGLGATGTEG